MNKLKILRLNRDAKLPTRAYKTDCGLDIYSLQESLINPGDGVMLSTGISAEFPVGYCGMLTDRSSMAKKGFKVAGGILDPGFTGELKVVLRNISNNPMTVEIGDRIAQLLILPMETPEVEEVTSLEKSERSNRGFGSSGR